MRLQDMKMIMESLEDGARKEEHKKLISRHDTSMQAFQTKQNVLEINETKTDPKIGTQVA